MLTLFRDVHLTVRAQREKNPIWRRAKNLFTKKKNLTSQNKSKMKARWEPVFKKGILD